MSDDKPKKAAAVPVASIHAHFNIFRPNEAPTGPITRDEQIAAVDRFLKWHRRQVELGQQLLKELAAAKAAEEPPVETPPTHEEGGPR